MEMFKIYLAGAMSGLSMAEQNEYRVMIEDYLEKCDSIYNVHCWNPVDYYNFIDKNHETEREIMEFDLDKVRQSDLIIVNFKHHLSLGTMAELAVAYDRGIKIIALNEDHEDLHPWQTEMSFRIFDNMKTMLKFIKKFYLN